MIDGCGGSVSSRFEAHLAAKCRVTCSALEELSDGAPELLVFTGKAHMRATV